MRSHVKRLMFATLIMLGGTFTLSAQGVSNLPVGYEDSVTARADNGMERLDADECRVLAESGVILSMMELMDKVKMLTDGHMLDTSLIKQGEEYIYEMEVAGKDGVVRMLLVDARTGDMIKEK